MEIFDPTYAATDASSGASPLRPINFARDSIVMFSNSKPNAPELLDGIRSKLHSQYERSDIDFVKKDTASLPAPKPLIEQVASQYQIAIHALGDCGSCSSYCFQDSLELERRGVATFIVVTTVFEKLVQAHAGIAGIEPRLIVLDHPVAGLTPDALQARIDQAFGLLLNYQSAVV